MTRAHLDKTWTVKEDDGRLAPPPTPALSYDERQMNAVLKACAKCGNTYYFTNHFATVCGACRT